MPFPRDGEDALEAWLRFPLHQVIGECHGWWRISPSQVGSDRVMVGRGGPQSNFSGYIIYPCSLGFQCLIHTTYYSGCRDGEFELGARSVEGGGRAFQLHRSDPGSIRYCSFFPTRSLGDSVEGGEGSKSRAAKGKTSQPVGKTPTPRARSKLVRELCNALPRVDGKDYHVIWKEIRELKASTGSDAVVAAKQWASEAQSLANHYKTELEEMTH
ncbi:hypothetical protein BHE74_00023879 [Ensete ventricosum]|nr:hypothetical protein BHE74_00023879 [Ensete ventricosum]